MTPSALASPESGLVATLWPTIIGPIGSNRITAVGIHAGHSRLLV